MRIFAPGSGLQGHEATIVQNDRVNTVGICYPRECIVPSMSEGVAVTPYSAPRQLCNRAIEKT